MKILKLSIKNMQRHKIKNLMIGIMITLVSFMFFITASFIKSSAISWRDFIASTFLGRYNITTYKKMEKDYTIPGFSLGEREVNKKIIEYLDKNNILYSKRLKLGGIIYNHAKGEFERVIATVIGVDLEKEFDILSNLTISNQGYNNTTTDNSIFVWSEFAQNLKWKVGDEITLFLKDIDDNAYPYTFKLKGILNQQSGPSLEGRAMDISIFPIIFVSYEYLCLMLGVEKGNCTEIAVWDSDWNNEKNLKKLAGKYGMDFFYGERGFGALYGIIELFSFIGGFLIIFILIIMIVSTLNLNMMSFFERQKEIGTILSIGAKPWWVIKLLVTEMVVLSSMAFAVSIAAYSIFSMVFSKGIDFGDLNIAFAGSRCFFHFVGSSTITAFLFIIGAMLISLLYPVYLVKKINPIQVFREGNI